MLLLQKNIPKTLLSHVPFTFKVQHFWNSINKTKFNADLTSVCWHHVDAGCVVNMSEKHHQGRSDDNPPHFSPDDKETIFL
jgi:hypothetical protein